MYNGKELVDQHGLNWYHYGARYYDPQLARWIEMDPADEFNTPYSYVGNMPTRLVDPTGKQSHWAEAKFERGFRQANPRGYTEYQRVNAYTGASVVGAMSLVVAWDLSPWILNYALTKWDKIFQIAEGILLPQGHPSTVISTATFAQKIFSNNFSDDGKLIYSEIAGTRINTIDDLAMAIKQGAVNPKDVPVDYVVIEGNALIHNTRTAIALERAGIPRAQWNAVDQTKNAEVMQRVVNQLNKNELSSSGFQKPMPE